MTVLLLHDSGHGKQMVGKLDLVRHDRSIEQADISNAEHSWLTVQSVWSVPFQDHLELFSLSDQSNLVKCASLCLGVLPHIQAV